MISVNNLSIQFGGNYLFEHISFIINDKDRIGLVGKNGAGKTTLLRLIAGEVEPEKGNIIIPSNLTVGYLPQEMQIKSDKSVFDEAISAFSEAIKIKDRIDSYISQIAGISDFETEDYYKIIDNLNEANYRFKLIEGQTIQAKTEKVLFGLGFVKSDFNRFVNEFSEGWQMRLELAKILLKKPELILLDEPCNNLDIESIQWLENLLINYNGAVVIVSHDRAFLDNITKRTIEISSGKIYDYKVCYSDYAVLRSQQIKKQFAVFTNQQKQINEIEKFINKFRYKAAKARQVQSRIKALKKMNITKVDDTDDSSIYFRFPPAPHSGKVVVEANGLTKNFGSEMVFNNLNFVIKRNDFVAFVGKNGEGKTTLTRIIAGDLDYKGELKIGHNVVIAYYAQNSAKLLNQNKTVFETIDEIAVGDIRSRIRNILGGFLFGGETIDKKVKVLSGGEKSRLALVKLLLSPANLLVLDEPTNNLDMKSKDVLKNALLHYDGTLIVVSHDRDFLQGLTNKVFEFKNHKIKEYFGDIYDFLESRKIESLKDLEENNNVNKKLKDDEPSKNKLIWEKKRLLDKQIRKINNQIIKSEKQIECIEGEINKIDKVLTNPQKHKDEIRGNDIFKKYENLRIKLKDEMSRWEDLNHKLEELKS